MRRIWSFSHVVEARPLKLAVNVLSKLVAATTWDFSCCSDHREAESLSLRTPFLFPSIQSTLEKSYLRCSPSVLCLGPHLPRGAALVWMRMKTCRPNSSRTLISESLILGDDPLELSTRTVVPTTSERFFHRGWIYSELQAKNGVLIRFCLCLHPVSLRNGLYRRIP